MPDNVFRYRVKMPTQNYTISKTTVGRQMTLERKEEAAPSCQRRRRLGGEEEKCVQLRAIGQEVVREVEPRHRDNVAQPSYSEDRKQVVHVPDHLVVDQVQQTEEEKRKRFATTPDDITDVTSQADRSQRPSKVE
ncbi:hypothetical protein LSH36_120g11028 [Paralvinella palmiformis]|uniref:Uncharacterized protein n=1 Tax=Paralvinella palmiformis TaxID=53620 RepID=A0AAD9JXU7_9ANNE|nr:hypothetical protein LSH36_120g11028 [Paralvinella palmiformis]